MTTTTTPLDTAPVSTQLAVYDTYAEAQAAVDTLSDEGFAVEHVSIVWNRLRRIEYVTGRRTVVRAAGEGALSGAWFGAALGLLLSLFVALDPAVSELGLILTYTAVGALIGAVFTAVGHWMRRGERDFSALDRLEAESYEVWVDPRHAAGASMILGRRVEF